MKRCGDAGTIMCYCKKCCASLVAIMYTMGYPHKRICEVTGYKSSSVGNIISRRFGTRKERGHIVRTRWGAVHDEPDIIDAIEAEYLAGASVYDGVEYTPGITLKKLYERDGGVCQICGERVDYRDRAYGVSCPTYPSIDHIIAMKNCGGHTWDNVQLAHMLCNSHKRDLR